MPSKHKDLNVEYGPKEQENPPNHQHSQGKLSRTVKQLKRAMMVGTHSKHSFSPLKQQKEQGLQQGSRFPMKAPSLESIVRVKQSGNHVDTQKNQRWTGGSENNIHSKVDLNHESWNNKQNHHFHSQPTISRNSSTKLNFLGRRTVSLLRISLKKNGTQSTEIVSESHLPIGSVDTPEEENARRRYVRSLQSSHRGSKEDIPSIRHSLSNCSAPSSINSVFEPTSSHGSRSETSSFTVSAPIRPSRSVCSSTLKVKKENQPRNRLLRSLSSLTRLGKRSHNMTSSKDSSQGMSTPNGQFTKSVNSSMHSLRPSGAATPSLSRSSPLLQNSYFITLEMGCTNLGFAVCSAENMRNELDSNCMTSMADIVRKDTSPSILLNPQGVFHSMGDTASRYYYQLSSTEKKKWLYVDSFMRQIFSKMTMSTDMTIFARNDVELLVCDLMVSVLTHCVETIRLYTAEGVDLRQCQWMIAIPDGWSYEILCDTWRLATEKSELHFVQFISTVQAIWLFVRESTKFDKLVHSLPRETRKSMEDHRDMERGTVKTNFSRDDNKNVISIQERNESPGKILIVKMGGEMTFVSVKELNGNKFTITSAIPTCGSSVINNGFIQLFQQLFGPTTMTEFQEKHPSGHYDLLQEIEFQKRTLVSCHAEKRTYLSLFLPFSFLLFIQKILGRTVEKVIRDRKDTSILWSPEGVLQISLQRMRRLFDVAITRIEYEIQELIKKFENIEKVIIVGGFAESPLVRDELQQFLGQKHELIIPTEPSLCILKGMKRHIQTTTSTFRHNHPLINESHLSQMPSSVSTFTATHTYGLAILRPFQDNVHPPSKRVIRHGQVWCLDIFDCLIERGDSYVCGYSIERQFCPASTQQKLLKVNLYRYDKLLNPTNSRTEVSSDTKSSSHPSPIFITDPGIRLAGQLVIHLKPKKGRSTPQGSTEIPSKLAAAISRQSSFATNECQRRAPQPPNYHQHVPQQIKTQFIFNTERHIAFKAIDMRQNVTLTSHFYRPRLKEAAQSTEIIT